MSGYLRHALQFVTFIGLLFIGTFAHALTLNVSLNPDRVRPNEGLRAMLTVTNDSGSPVSNLVLRATMPAAGVNFITTSFTTGGATCSSFCDPGELVTWNIGTLGAGQGVTVTMAMVVTNATADGTVITLPAEVLVNGVQTLTSSKSVAVDNDNALTLGLDENKDAVAPGETLTYTLTYGNRSSNNNVTGTTLSVPLPAGTAFVAASGGGTLNGSNVEWLLGTLQPGQSGRQQIIVTVDGGLTSGAIVSVDAAVLAGTGSVTGAELARATAVTRVRVAPDLGLAIEAGSDPVRQLEGLRSKLTVTNRTAFNIFNAVLVARMPTDGVNFITSSFTTGGATCSSFCDPYELVTWNLGTLAPGASVTVTMAMQVTSGTASGELITLEAVVTGDNVTQATATHTVAVDNDNALTLGLDENKDAVAPGETLTYTLTYGNRSSNNNVTGVVLAFPVPEGATLIGSSGGTVSGGVVTWNIGTLSPGSGGREVVTVSVPGTPPESLRLLVDAAVLSGTGSTTGAEIARAAEVTRIFPNNPIKLVVSVAPNPVGNTNNQSLTGTLQVTNAGAVNLTNVTLVARMPTDGVVFITASSTTGGATCSSFCDPYELVTWALGTLTPGQVVTVTMSMPVINNTAPGLLIDLDAFVTADGGVQAADSDIALVGTGVFSDSDGDGVSNQFDNCLNHVNPDQRDTNGDGYGNRCDADLDQSNFVNAADLAIFKTRFGTNNADADLDGSGFVNAADLAIFKTLFGKAPGPSGLAP